MREYALDNCYRARWQEYYTADGRKYDSRETYWRMVPWQYVVEIKTYIRDKVYLTHCRNAGFRYFVVYRWGGWTWKMIEGTAKKIAEWAVGWSDGEKCFMTDIDFHTGEVVRQYVVSAKEVQHHIHPACGGTLECLNIIP